MLLTVATVREAEMLLAREFGELRVGEETVPLSAAFSRVAARDLHAPDDLPAFSRSTVDGYAVRACDTFGASESMPSLLALGGRMRLGDPAAPPPVGPGAAVYVPTGGELPPGADAVVMVEHAAEPAPGEVALERPAAPGENVLARGEDLRAGAVAVRGGTMLRPQEIGLLAACGIERVPVFARPRVAVISSGDEVVPVGETPGRGRVRDVNAHALAAGILAAGAEPVPGGIVPDDLALLSARLAECLAACDAVLLSGGSSAGTMDHTVAAIDAAGRPGVLLHGLAMKPGKPTIVGRVGAKAVFGLPGHPAACLVVFDRLVAPLLRGLGGLSHPPAVAAPRAARISRDHGASPGREEILPVRLAPGPDGPLAHPVYGKSGSMRPLSESDGFVVIPAEREGLCEGDEVEVLPW